MFALQSRKPPLGKPYIQQLARDRIEKRIGIYGFENPHDPEYMTHFLPYLEQGKRIIKNPVTGKSQVVSSKVLLDKLPVGWAT